MRLDRQAALPEYTDGCFFLYDIVDDEEGRKIRARDISRIWYRDIGVYDRTRVTFEQDDKEITMKIRIPVWDGTSSNCVCMIGGTQHKVYNKANVLSSQGYPETELTLINPPMDYDIIEEGN